LAEHESGASPPLQIDARFMLRALELAERGLGLASPNPMVGAVVVAGGEVVGEGWHEGPGTAHAEVAALARAGERARGATVYTTLEPCSHHGRTPPCAPEIVRAGAARVVAAVRDPNPVVDGIGLRILGEGGVSVTEGVEADAAARLIAGFAKHVLTGSPLVTLKMAASLDGKVAARDGSSRWVTGEAARQDVHRLRAASDAVLVGAGTALADHPALTVRLEAYRGRQPLRVLADATGRTGVEGPLFERSAPTLVATTPSASDQARAAWTGAGADVVVLDATEAGEVPLPALTEHLGKRDVQNLLVEGGPTLAWSAVRDGVVDRLVLYLAPKLIGGTEAPGVLAGEGIGNISGGVRVQIESVGRIGEDLKVVGRVHRDR
jgi:diaminohydroxyphosphoribosylaminopyrimidine deaminase / 5-amino-6-(5-phosphoribosylamino)uracil reductase